MKNKNHLIYLVALCSMVMQHINAQQKAQVFRAGLTAGVLISDINGADQRDSDNDFHKVGFTAGGLVNTRISKKDVLQLEMNFIQKGSMQPPDSSNNGFYRITLNYVEVPLIIKHRIHFNLFKKPRDNFDLEGGVSYGRLVKATQYGNANYSIPGAASAFNITDISLHAGVDYNFSNNFYLCVRYSNSVIPAVKHNASYNTNFIRYTFNKGNNMVWQFSLKFVFGGKTSESSEKTDPVTE